MKGAKTERSLDRRYERAKMEWAPEELEYLAENIGLRSEDHICQHLGRSKNALKITAYRKLGKLNKRSNIYTLRSVGEIFGLKCAKTLYFWMDLGFIKGTRAPFCYGKHRVWSFKYEDILNCLTQYPWLFNYRLMPRSYFRSVIQEEYEWDPWLSMTEATKLIGVADGYRVALYIKKGWLIGHWKPGGPEHHCWYVRESAIANFLANDPRPAHRYEAFIKSKYGACAINQI